MEDEEYDFEALSTILDLDEDNVTVDVKKADILELDHSKLDILNTFNDEVVDTFELTSNGLSDIQKDNGCLVVQQGVIDNKISIKSNAFKDHSDNKLLEEIKRMQQKILILENQLKNKNESNQESNLIIEVHEKPLLISKESDKSKKECVNKENIKDSYLMISEKCMLQPSLSKSFATSMPSSEIKHKVQSFAESLQEGSVAVQKKLNKSTAKVLKNIDLDVKKMIYGDVDEDDWEGLDGEQNKLLSESGREIKTLLKSASKQRVAHVPNQTALEKDDNKKKDIPSYFSIFDNMPINETPTLKQNNSIKIINTNSAKVLMNKNSSKVSKAVSNIGEKASFSYISSLMGIPNVEGLQSSYNSENCSMIKASSSSSSRTTDKVTNENVMKDQFSGIRIINPLVPADQMKQLMENRRMVLISTIKCKLNTPAIDGDWVTMGVLVNKSEQRISAKGKKYSIWKLSDLVDCHQSALVSLFLFREVNTEMWKTIQGTVIGILNPTIMPNTEKNQNGSVNLTVDNFKKILLLGKSKDLGFCKGCTKAGNNCSNFLNLQQGDYCNFHIQSAYKKQSAKRSELQSGFSGIIPKFKKSFDQIRNNYNGGCSYKNDVYTTRPLKKQPEVSLKTLIDHHKFNMDSLKDASFVQTKKFNLNTLALHELLPENFNNKLKSSSNLSCETNPNSLKESKPSISKSPLSNHRISTPHTEKSSYKNKIKDSPLITKPKDFLATVTSAFENDIKDGNKVKNDETMIKDDASMLSSAVTINEKSPLSSKIMSAKKNSNSDCSRTGDNKNFLDKLTIPTAGSMNFVKHLKNIDKSLTSSLKTTGNKLSSNEGVPILKASEIFKEFSSAKTLMPTVDTSINGIKINDKPSGLIKSKTINSDSFLECKNNIKLSQLDNKFNNLNNNSLPKNYPTNRSNNCLTEEILDTNVTTLNQISSYDSTLLEKNSELFYSNSKKLNTSTNLSIFPAPMLGRGIGKEGFLDFFDSNTSLPAVRTKKEIIALKAKLRAEEKVKIIGGLIRQNPNAVRKRKKSLEFQEKISKKIKKDEELSKIEHDKMENGILKKSVSKILGNVDLNSPEIQKLMKAKSINAGMLSEIEKSKQEEYFDVLEKTETMENKMMSIMEIEVKAISCLVCKYTALSASTLCINEGHSLNRHKATKRFFKCKDCKCRCITLDRLPTIACRKCGGNNFERTGMMEEKKGPKLANEELLLRGEEIKYLNS